MPEQPRQPGTGLAVAPARADLELTVENTANLSTFAILPIAAQIAEAVCRTEFVPRAMRGKPDVVTACILAGHSLGLDPMVALGNIDVIEGRPAPSAKLMRAMVLSRGHDLWIEEKNNTRVTLGGKRKDSDHATKITWTMDDARTAGLANKDVWKRYPRAMLMARATGELCRDVFPDIVAGLAYTREEVADGFDEWFEEEAPPADEEAAPQGQTRQLPEGPAKKAAATKKAARPRKAAAKKAAAPRPPDTGDLVPLPGDEQDAADDAADRAMLDEEGGDVVDAEVVEEGGDSDEGRTPEGRANRIAWKAREAGIADHHELVWVITGGQATSAKTLNDAQADAVFDAIRRIKIGEAELDSSGPEPVLRDIEPAAEPEPEPAAPDDGDPDDLANVDTWDGDKWRAYLQARGLKVVGALVEAKRLAVEAQLAEPTTLNDLQGQPTLAALVLAWAEEQAEGS